jgi:phosphoribosylanthranilate isomerase
MIIQIYETQNALEARQLEALGVDHVGVLVGHGAFAREMDYAATREIFAALGQARKVALSLSRHLDEVCEVAAETRPDILHLGTVMEGLLPADLATIKQRFPHVALMRTIAVIGEESIAQARAYNGVADYLLLDTYKAGDNQVGATGETHNWEISRAIREAVPIPVILAGGLGPENVATAIQQVAPAGVDSKTRTDLGPGPQKDLDKVRDFVRQARG